MISVEEDGLLHKLDIINPVMADIGKYSCEINGVSTQAYLDVEGKHFLEFYESYQYKEISNFLIICAQIYSVIRKIFNKIKNCKTLYVIT